MSTELYCKLIAHYFFCVLIVLSASPAQSQDARQKAEAAEAGQSYSPDKLRQAIQQGNNEAIQEQLKIYREKRLEWANESSRADLEQSYRSIDKIIGPWINEQKRTSELESHIQKGSDIDYASYLSKMRELIEKQHNYTSEVYRQQQQKFMAEFTEETKSSGTDKTVEKSVIEKIERLKLLREQVQLDAQKSGWTYQNRPKVEKSYYDMLSKNPALLDQTLDEYEARVARKTALDKQIEHIRNWNPRAQIDLTEQQYGTLSNASPFNLVVWCGAYSTAKNYAKLYECIAEMHRRIDADKRYFCLNPTFDHPDYCKSQSQALDDFMEYILDYESAIALDLARPQEALSKYEEKLRIRKSRFTRSNKQAWSKRYEGSDMEESAQLAILNAFTGNADAVNQYVAVVEKFTLMEDKKCERLSGISANVPGLGGFIVACTRGAMGNMNLASTFMATQKYEDALIRLDRATKSQHVINNQSGNNRYSINIFGIRIESMRARALFELGRYEEAEDVYQQLLDRPGLNSWGSIYWYVQYDLGRIALHHNQTDKAIDYLKSAIQAIERIRSTINSEAGKIGFVEDKQEVYRTLIEALMRQKRTTEAFEYVERSKARALVDLLASQKRFGRANTGANIDGVLDELTEAELETYIQDPQEDPKKLGQRQTRASTVRRQLIQKDPELASLVTVSPASLKEVQSLLSKDETLLEYYQRGDTLFAFVVTRNRISGVDLKGKGLHRDVNYFRKVLASSESDQYSLLASRLYRRLILPLTEQIQTRNITIVPHGILHYLPLSALGTEEGFLIDRYAIRILPSASVMQFLKKEHRAGGRDLLVLGNPTTQRKEQELKHADREARDVAALQTLSTLLLESDASETAFREHGAEHRRVHFASHAYFNPTQPLQSGVLLAQDGENDGYLTAAELYTMNLPLDMVTLSACETGLGDVSEGDDVIGLTRGFIYAGARTIVASLWKVDDESTSDLMVEFYRQLEQNDKAEALRKAQHAIRMKHPHPYYWAAFQIMGSRL